LSDYLYLGLLISGFIGYFVLHSCLASLQAKNYVLNRFAGLLAYYRLLFNVVSVLLLLPLVWFMQVQKGPPLWHWTGIGYGIANTIALAAIGVFFWTLRQYDGKEFIGLRQIQEKTTAVHDLENFQLSTPHRFVRHPWYCAALLILWTRDIYVTQLISYGLISLYFILGSRLEERKLIQYHGDVYRTYQKKVPALFPLPWRYLTREEAIQLVEATR